MARNVEHAVGDSGAGVIGDGTGGATGALPQRDEGALGRSRTRNRQQRGEQRSGHMCSPPW